MTIDAIVTIPPYAPFLKDLAKHQMLGGFRLNTVMPTKESLVDVLKRIKDIIPDKPLYVDLKARQLRVKNFGVPPFTEIEITHNISVNTPVDAYFSDGKERATLLEVNGNKLIMQEGPKRIIGPGESINIPDRSLQIDGFLTDVDKKYMDASLQLGLHDYMLSFVESQADVNAFYKLDPQANLVEKIESKKGMYHALNEWKGKSRLMTARGDLYLEVGMPHQIVAASSQIVNKDPHAIVASRIFNSLSNNLDPSCADIGDVDSLMRMGYQTFMLGDDVCMEKNSVMSAMNLLYAMAQQYGGK